MQGSTQLVTPSRAQPTPLVAYPHGAATPPCPPQPPALSSFREPCTYKRSFQNRASVCKRHTPHNHLSNQFRPSHDSFMPTSQVTIYWATQWVVRHAHHRATTCIVQKKSNVRAHTCKQLVQRVSYLRTNEMAPKLHLRTCGMGCTNTELLP
jgi:hypothetical protein